MVITRLFLVICTVVFALPPLEAQLLRNTNGQQVVEVEAVAPNIVRVHIEPAGTSSPRTLVMDPALKTSSDAAFATVSGEDGSDSTLTFPAMQVVVSNSAPFNLQVTDGKGAVLLSLSDLVKQATEGGLVLKHDFSDRMYGMRGLEMRDTGAGIDRSGGATVAIGMQGDGGAPFFFTTRYGVLIDSDGGEFNPLDESLRFVKSSRKDVEFFVILGPPYTVMEGLAQLTGKAPMPPKWTLGFMNSQWGSSEAEIREIAKTYAAKQIPISAFILDFDWKAWGEDNYGEWRWNSTSGPGNDDPDKFPHGASGEFANDLLGQGIHLAGILKPRILVDNVDGKPTEAAAYATAHNFWYPGSNRVTDYQTHRTMGNLDFNNPEMRKWFWDHLLPAFHTGMTAWWNDEADASGGLRFNNFQFPNMARALYEGQRADSDERVWSINRAYYLGALRYSYAMWSGDLTTGFRSMAFQRRRMIASLNLGEPEWSMDTGGFSGHPTPENYARWMEFATFVPFDRVHGGIPEKRQPWVYGPTAEAAAKRALRLRYDPLPYIYSNARQIVETGIGVVRPLFWEFPNDRHVADETRSWMFGDALLVSPVVERGETSHALYLPAGGWFDYATGKRVEGGRELSVATDATTWTDIPLFVREGSILATQPATTGKDLSPKAPLVLDVFPSTARAATFAVYDDDGHTYAYEKGSYFRQEVKAVVAGEGVDVTLSAAEGSFKPEMTNYILRVHTSVMKVTGGPGTLRKFASEAEMKGSTESGWASAQDRFGPVMVVRMPVGQPGAGVSTLMLR
jgi:alpha-glucosidase